MTLKGTINYLERDERKAPGDYIKLKREVRSPKSRKIIDSIIRQEKQHEKKLEHIEKIEGVKEKSESYKTNSVARYSKEAKEHILGRLR